jgi:FAD binding domain
MATNTVTNWFRNIISHPTVIVDAHSVDDIIDVMKNPANYPAPVRAVGSNHSTAPCGVAEGGTLIRMKMNQILNVGQDSLTVQAGQCTLIWRRRWWLRIFSSISIRESAVYPQEAPPAPGPKMRQVGA